MKKKYSSHISVLLLTFVLVFMVSGFLFPRAVRAAVMGICTEGKASSITAKADCTGAWKELKAQVPGGWEKLGNAITGAAQVGGEILLAPLGWLTLLILQIATLITNLGGMILNYATQFTIVDMSKNIRNIGSIDTAWKTIRDVANMGFIFILLYAAIKTILGMGDDIRKLIVNIVIVAILINFSLFFTKVVIDASNILSTLFYDAIAPTSLTDPGFNVGLSGKMMGPLQLTSLWDTGNIGVFETKGNIIIGVMGTIVSLIAAFVFFAVAIMFVIRFVVLIFVMILSPLAFMGYILPQLKKHKDDWIQALLGQAFFTPIYFMLTWIVIQISESLLPLTKASAGGSMATAFLGAVGADGNTAPPPIGSIALLMNFIIMIVFLIASLIIAKKWADKAGHGVPGLTKWATGFAGGATLGAIGIGMRGSIGSRAAAMAKDEELKKKAAEGSIRARLQLATASKAAKSSFDLRGTPLSGQLDAGKAKKGGFIQDQKDRAKAYEKYKPDSDAIKTAKAEATKAQERLDAARKKATQSANTEVEKTPEFIEAEKQLKEAQEDIGRPMLEGLSEADILSTIERRKAAVLSAQQNLENEQIKREQTLRQFVRDATQEEKSVVAQARLKRMELNNRMTRMANRVEKGWLGTGFGGVAVSAKDKADAIRAATKGKSKKERLADLAKEVTKEEEETEKPETSPETPPAEEKPTT